MMTLRSPKRNSRGHEDTKYKYQLIIVTRFGNGWGPRNIRCVSYQAGAHVRSEFVFPAKDVEVAGARIRWTRCSDSEAV
jgi:hypothetical protein